jgi:hypothetical protein
MLLPHAGRRDRAWTLAAIIVALAAGCTAPVMPVRDNPRDPDGTDYHNPGVELLSGPSNDSVIHENEVAFRWRGTGKADSFTCQLDAGDWLPWSTRDSVRYHFLDDGRHMFRLRAKSDHGILQLTPSQFSFNVDAVAGPALVSSPWHSRVTSNKQFSIQIGKKAVGPLSQAHLVVSYDQSVLNYDFTSAGSCWPANRIVTSNSTPGQVDVTIRLSPVGAGTSGDIVAWMYFTPTSQAAASPIEFTPATHLIGVSGDTLAVTLLRGSVLTVNSR